MSVGTRVRAVTLAVVWLLMMAACGGSRGRSVKEGGTLLVALDASAQTLDPLGVGDVASARPIAMMFPGLCQADKNLNILPELTDGMPKLSSDLKTCMVNFKTGAIWSDGTPITA